MKTVVTGCSQYPKQKQNIEEFGDFISADKIVYKDRGNGESYTIYKGDRVFEISVSGNRVDGG